jgi:hypothetical protein
MIIQDWINNKYADIASKLPTLVHTEPASFSCGFNAGYKQALRDLENMIEDGATLRKSMCRCGDKYHDYGDICL